MIFNQKTGPHPLEAAFQALNQVKEVRPDADVDEALLEDWSNGDESSDDLEVERNGEQNGEAEGVTSSPSTPFMTERGTYRPLNPQQQREAIDRVAVWLDAHPESESVHLQYLKLVFCRGTHEQQQQARLRTQTWLASHPEANEIREYYQRLETQNSDTAPSGISTTTQLTQWLTKEVEASWQTLEELFANSPPQLAFRSDDEKRGKLIDLGVRLAHQPLALIISLQPETDQHINLLIQLRPLDSETTLPPGLTLRLISETGEQLYEVIARDSDHLMQMAFDAEPAEAFSLELEWEDFYLCEDFIL